MRRLTALLAALVLAPAAHAAPSDRDAGVKLWQAIMAAEQVPTGWTGSTATCTKGTESPASIQATLTAVNDLRDFASLAPVTFDPAENDQALAAALIMAAQNDLSHDPPPTWACWTQEGHDAAGRSNLFLGETGAAAMVGYVDDSGIDSLGHRRWVLDPGATTFGTGSTDRTNALMVFPDPNATPPTPPSAVAWPPATWLPWDFVFGTWSLGFTAPGADISNATVTVTLDSQPRTVSNVRAVDSGYGSADPTLAWDVALAASDRTADHDLAVRIDGVTVNGAPVPITYTVHAFDTAPPQISKIHYQFRGGRHKGGIIQSVYTYTHAIRGEIRWLRNGKPIPGAVFRSYRIKAADRGRKVRIRVVLRGTGSLTAYGPVVKITRR